MGLARHDDPQATEREWDRRPPGDRGRSTAEHLTTADLAAIRKLLDEADRSGWHRNLARMPWVTLTGGLVVWSLALYGLWHLLT